MSNKLASLRRDLDHIRKHRTEIIAQKSRLATRLSDLNKDLKSKKIPYENYESKFKYLLGGKSVEEKKKYFKKRLVAIKHREKDLLSRIKHETHSSKNKSKLITVTAIMFAIFAPIIGSNLVELTGMATADTNQSSYVEVQSWIAASLTYSSVTFSGSAGALINASLNYDISASTTAYSINYSSDSNVEDLNVCIQGENIVSGANTISIDKLNTSAYNQTNTLATPARAASISVGTSDAQLINNVDPGDEIRQRYWLDIPATQTAASDYAGAVNITLKSAAC